MQHKSLLAALMVGVLALASCVKNEESQSVTDMRNARADEIKSQAELNRANAQAAVIYAKAEETIAAAQAQLLKAQADKTAAEAALIQAQADLAQVNVQIQLVKLEEEKVVLQAKKAELEKLIAEYEAAIAQADALKQEAINRLEKAIQQAELDEIKHQKALIDAQAELFASLTGMADAQRNRVAALYTAYTNAAKQVNTLQTQLLQKKGELAKIQAHLETGLDEAYEDIKDLKSEIASLEAQVEYYEYMSYTSYSDAMAKYMEIMPKVVLAMAAMEDAQVKSANAYNTWNDQFENPESGIYVQPEFTFGWVPTYDANDDPIFHKGFQEFAAEILGDELTSEVLGMNLNAKVWGYRDDLGNFVPLWSDEVKEYGDGYVYPESDGIYRGISSPFWDLENISPATIFYDNFKMLLGDYKDDMEDWKQYEIDNSGIPEAEEEIANLEEVIAQMAEYVAKADERIIPAKDAMDDAKDAKDEAWGDYLAAWDNLNNYATTRHLSSQLVEYQEAINRYNNAKNEDLLVDGQIVWIEGNVVTLMNNITAAKEAQLEADAAVVAQQLVVAEKEEAITDAIKTAYTEAQTAVETAKVAVETKFNEYQTKLDDAHAKELLYLADPDDAAKKTAYEQAKAAAETAKTAYDDAVTAVGTKKAELTAAKEAYDAVNDPYVAAKAVLVQKEGVAATRKAAVEARQKALSNAKDALEALKAQKLLTAEALVIAENERDEKKAAYEAYGTEDNPEYKALADACDDAWDEYLLKATEYDEAQSEYAVIQGSFQNYGYCTWNLDETYEGTEAYNLARLKEQLVVLGVDLADALAYVDWWYAKETQVDAELEQLKNIDEPVYHEWLEARMAAENAYDDSVKELVDVTIEYYDVMVEYEAIDRIIVFAQGPMELTRDQFDAMIAGIKAEIAELNEELAAKIEAFEEGAYSEAKQAELEADIAEIESKIEMYEALAESYWAELQYVMSGGIE